MLVNVNSMRPVLEGLMERLEPGLPGSALSEILNRLLWVTDDNGSDVVTVCREWLASGDQRRVEAALSIEDSWLYDDRHELAARLTLVREQWPQLAPRVEEILHAYDRRLEGPR